VRNPLTGDFLFSTFGGGNQVIAVRGFTPPAPPAPVTAQVPTLSTRGVVAAARLMLDSGLALVRNGQRRRR
jgi:hypothetical protein